MKNSKTLAAVAALGVLSLVPIPHASAERPSSERAIRGVAHLGWEIVRTAEGRDVVVSPLGVWEALAMAHAGARGETASEIARVLGMGDDARSIGAASTAIRTALTAATADRVVVRTANRLWVQSGQPLEHAFTERLARDFAAQPGIVDFVADPDAAREEINRWVSDRTGARIDRLLGPGSVATSTRVVLTNAIYLKAAWAVPFQESATHPAPFHLAPGESVPIPFMRRTAHLQAGTVEGATVVEIPYLGDRLSMIVAVPEAVDGLDRVVEGLSGDWHDLWTSAMTRRRVAIELPRFSARTPLSLGDALQRLGMARAFDPSRADFSGIDGSRDLFVSAVVHEGFVEVTEVGTEAAAATGVAVTGRSALRDPEPPLVVKVDRPFVWTVVERGSGALLFAGVTRDPRGD